MSDDTTPQNDPSPQSAGVAGGQPPAPRTEVDAAIVSAWSPRPGVATSMPPRSADRPLPLRVGADLDFKTDAVQHLHAESALGMVAGVGARPVLHAGEVMQIGHGKRLPPLMLSIPRQQRKPTSPMRTAIMADRNTTIDV